MPGSLALIFSIATATATPYPAAVVDIMPLLQTRSTVQLEYRGRSPATAGSDDKSSLVRTNHEVEALWYMPGSGGSQVENARLHLDQISVLAPQTYIASTKGIIEGSVDERLIELASKHSKNVMPLIMNVRFDQNTIHGLLMDRPARERVVQSMVDIGNQNHFWGWQFDFGYIHISDQNSLTSFYAQATRALHAAGMVISIAVVPSGGKKASTPYVTYMEENRRGSFDVTALADIGDFISLMTYSQPGVSATPGPVAGLGWMRMMLGHALELGVPAEKISLGIPSYSGHWYSDYTTERGARVQGREISYTEAARLIEAWSPEIHWLDDEDVWTILRAKHRVR